MEMKWNEEKPYLRVFNMLFLNITNLPFQPFNVFNHFPNAVYSASLFLLKLKHLSRCLIVIKDHGIIVIQEEKTVHFSTE